MILQTDDLVKHAAPSFREYWLACLKTVGCHKQPISIDTCFGSSVTSQSENFPELLREGSRTMSSIFPVTSLIFRTNLEKKI